MTESQTFWKRITVPAALLAAGWKLVKRDTSAPFAMVNEKLDADTGGHPDPHEAIAAATALLIEREEAAAIAAEGAVITGPRPTTLPLALVDEGWKLRRASRGIAGRPFFAHRGTLRTIEFPDPADAVAEAITLEADRQAKIEHFEQLEQVGESDQLTVARAFVARGQAAQAAVDAILSEPGDGNGHQETTPAEILLELDRIRTDGGTQQRSLFDHSTMVEYCEMMGQGEQFPAVDVFFDGAAYWLADGFYRLEARRQLGEAAIAAHVRQGTQRDAVLFSLGANARHGLPRTPEDKRRAVLVMLRDPEWATWSDAFIAERVRVSVPLVRKLRHQEAAAQAATETTEQAQPAPPASTRRKGRDGRVQDTARIGKRSKTDSAIHESVNPQLSLDAPAPVFCSDCDNEITASSYQNALGQCWSCAGMDQKKTGSKKSEPAPRPSVDELRQDKNLTIGFVWRRTKDPRRVGVVVELGSFMSRIEIPSLLIWPFLPDVVIAKIQDLARARARQAKKQSHGKATVSRGTTKQTTPKRGTAKRQPATKPAKRRSTKRQRG